MTFAQYDAFVQATKGTNRPDDEGWGRANRPVINVSWDDAHTYAKWLSTVTGKRYRLPTETEWEYAARAGTQTEYWWGGEIGENRANCGGCGSEWDNKQTAPVGSFDSNPWALHDTAGNVWEWMEDCWHDNYEGEPPRDGLAWREESGGDCGRRVVRGGSWRTRPGNLHSAYRLGLNTVDRGSFIGFRLIQDL